MATADGDGSKKRAPAIIKLAVQWDNKQPVLYDFDQKQPLAAIVRAMCQRWGIQNADRFAFKHMDTNTYITEKNRQNLANGVILKLALSPAIEARDTFELLRDSPANDSQIMRSLALMCKDASFASEFAACGGLRTLALRIEQQSDTLLENAQLGPALTALQELVDNGGNVWGELTPSLVAKICSYVVSSNPDALIMSKSLSILESVVSSSNNASLIKVVHDKVTIQEIGKHLQQTSDLDRKVNALGVLNALMMRASISERQDLHKDACSFRLREALYNTVVNQKGNVQVEMAQQLHIYQALQLSLIANRMQTRFDPDNKLHMVSLQALPQSVFPDEYATLSNSRRPTMGGSGPGLAGANIWKKLGFVNANPAHDFNEVPPGVLALECLVFFARSHPESCNKFLLDNMARRETHQCPFARSGVVLSRLLCDILHVGEVASEVATNFLPIFYSTEYFFEELFSICIQLLNKTWREMGAGVVDFEKVITVVRKQITEVLKLNPRNMADLKRELWEMTYSRIIGIIDDEKHKIVDVTTRSKPVIELRDRIKPQVVDLVKKQRLLHLTEGALFHTFTNRGRQQRANWCCRLSPNHRVLHWNTPDDSCTHVLPLEELPKKVAVQEIRELLCGRDKVPNSVKSQQYQFALRVTESEMTLDFVAEDEKQYAIWIDGLRVLLNQPMEHASEDIDMLLNMDMKLRLLDVENAPIPDQPPKIPPDPPNLDFYYKDR
ncbi:engulfment and cell motility protein 2-like [Sycon ciliatum]|uniref:engulfment and cell motility protein 2-like n=1 Tax=Sycon ciliatum TaxID=27933 RepID=UPI0031F62304